jgi:hypothetical protein
MRIITDIPVQVEVYSFHKKDFIPVKQVLTETEKMYYADVNFKKIAKYSITPTKQKILARMTYGNEYTVYYKRFSSNSSSLTGYDLKSTTKLKTHLTYRLTPKDSKYSPVIYRTNALKNSRVLRNMLLTNLPWLIFYPTAIAIDGIYWANYDFPSEITFHLKDTYSGLLSNETIEHPEQIIKSDKSSISSSDRVNSEYYYITTQKLEVMKGEMVKAGNYDAANLIKNELDERHKEQTEIDLLKNLLQKNIAEDNFAAAAENKKALEEKTQRLDKKNKLRAEIEKNQSNIEKCNELKNELKTN